MTRPRQTIARQALAMARRVRIGANVPADAPLCIYDLIEGNYGDELELRFKAAPSLEGLYVKGDAAEGISALIIVSSLRPSGRQRMTAAHELGHHLFGHGSTLDQIVEPSSLAVPADEFLVDSFASFLMMPKLGLLKAFFQRGTDLPLAEPIEIYRVACQFGVGYTALIHHLYLTLRELPTSQADQLLKKTPKSLRAEALGFDAPGELLIVDEHWSKRAIDLSIGDHLTLPIGTKVEGHLLEHIEKRPIGDVYRASKVGRGRVDHVASSMAAYLRISRSQFEGRAMFRHLEECDDE